MPLDITAFRAFSGGDPEKIKESQRRRHKPEEIVDEIIATDEKWRLLTGEIDNIKKKRNAVQKEVGLKKKAGEECDGMVGEIRELDALVEMREAEQKEHKTTVDKLLSKVGNIVHDSVPVGIDEDKDNRVERSWGTPRSAVGLLNHAELLWCIGGYEPDRGVTVAGHRGYFLKDAGVLLNQAFINYSIDFLRKRNYSVLQPPYMMKKDVMSGVAQLEQFDEELYKVGGAEGVDGDSYLIATSEQPICAYHKDEWLEEKSLPIRYSGVSTCFRKEAGSHGKDNWGIFRVHQFEKVEQFIICEGDLDKSEAMQQEMIATAEAFYQSLGFPYHVINIVSGALNNAAIKKYDLEAWFPGYEAYRELVSCSNCTDYQSRAMEIRCGIKKLNDKEKRYVHMLNATLCATGRAICCLLENYQEPDGVRIPDVLVPFMGGITFLPFVRELKGSLRDAGKKAASGPTILAPAAAPVIANTSNHQNNDTPLQESGNPEVDALAASIVEKGNVIRDLKESKADKAVIKIAVDELLALKTSYKELAGRDYGSAVVSGSEPKPADKSVQDASKKQEVGKHVAIPKTTPAPDHRVSGSSGSIWRVPGSEVDMEFLNSTLAAYSYVTGYVPSAEDKAVFSVLMSARVAASDLPPNAQRWFRHISSYAPYEMEAWE